MQLVMRDAPNIAASTRRSAAPRGSRGWGARGVFAEVVAAGAPPAARGARRFPSVRFVTFRMPGTPWAPRQFFIIIVRSQKPVAHIAVAALRAEKLSSYSCLF